jgi:hypothetical protein
MSVRGTPNGNAEAVAVCPFLGVGTDIRQLRRDFEKPGEPAGATAVELGNRDVDIQTSATRFGEKINGDPGAP